MRRMIYAGSSWLLSISLALSGCVSGPQVKQASSQMKEALVSVSGAEADFKKALLTEIDATRDQIGRAILARLVRDRIDAVAADYEKKGELIKLSDEIDAASSAAHQFVFAIRSLSVDAGATDDDLDGVIKDQLQKKQASLSLVLKRPELSQAEKADLMRQRDTLAIWTAPTYPGRTDLRTMLQLARTRAYVEKELLKQLDVHIHALANVHNTVDGWIQTDVTVHGNDVAKVVEGAKSLFPAPQVVTRSVP